MADVESNNSKFYLSIRPVHPPAVLYYYSCAMRKGGEGNYEDKNFDGFIS